MSDAGIVMVGRDTRSTGEMLQHAVQCGLLSAGCEVVDLGVLPTPTIQMYIGATRARGGIALTASHNPPEYNALKLFNSRGLFFNHYERTELIDLYHQSDFREAKNAEIGRVRQDLEAAAKAAHRSRARARGRRSHSRAAVPGGARCGERRRVGDDAGVPYGHAGLRPARDLDGSHQAFPARSGAEAGDARRSSRAGAAARAAKSASRRIRTATGWR